MTLTRFHTAQASSHAGYPTALTELRSGQKTSHWIWYIFPQLLALGRSPTATRYGLLDLDEACLYLRDPELRDRLLEVTRVVAIQLQAGAELDHLMGAPIDALKLVSSLTLFEVAASELLARPEDTERPLDQDEVTTLQQLLVVIQDVLAQAERQDLVRCKLTLQELGLLES